MASLRKFFRLTHDDSLIEDTEFDEGIVDFEGVGLEFGLDALDAGNCDCVANNAHGIVDAGGADAAINGLLASPRPSPRTGGFRSTTANPTASIARRELSFSLHGR